MNGEACGEVVICVIDFENSAEGLRGGVDDGVDVGDAALQVGIDGFIGCEYVGLTFLEGAIHGDGEIHVDLKRVERGDAYDGFVICEGGTGFCVDSDDLSVEGSFDVMFGEAFFFELEVGLHLSFIFNGKIVVGFSLIEHDECTLFFEVRGCVFFNHEVGLIVYKLGFIESGFGTFYCSVRLSLLACYFDNKGLNAVIHFGEVFAF